LHISCITCCLLLSSIIVKYDYNLVLADSPDLIVEALWQFGRGTIYDFDFVDTNLFLASSNGVWYTEPIADRSPSRWGEEDISYQRLSISPDGSHLVTTSNGMTQIRNVSSGQNLVEMNQNQVGNQFAWSPNSRLLATETYLDSEASYNIALWDIRSLEVVIFGGYSDLIVALRWHPNGELLAVRLSNGTIFIENVIIRQRVQELTAAPITSASMSWSPDGTKFAATSDTVSPVKIWRNDTFEQITTNHQPTFIVALAWNADGTSLAGSYESGGVGVWNIETDEVTSIGFHADNSLNDVAERLEWQGNLLASLDRNGYLKVWDVPSNQLAWASATQQFHGEMQDFAVSEDGAFVAISYLGSNEITVINGNNGQLLQVLNAPRPLDVTRMAWSLSNDQLAVASTNLLIWSFQPDGSSNVIEVEDVRDFSWFQDDTLAISSDSEQHESELRLIDSETGELRTTHNIEGLIFPRWSPNGCCIAIYRNNQPSNDLTMPQTQIDILDIERDSISSVIMPFSTPFQAIPSGNFVWLPDSSGLIGFTDDGALWNWAISSGKSEIILPTPLFDVTNQSFPLTINASGTLVAFSNITTLGHIRIFDTMSLEFLLTDQDIALTRYPFYWGDNDKFFVYQGVLRAFQITKIQ